MSEQTDQACVACGKPLRPGARFCTACGTPVDAAVVVVEAQRPGAAAPATQPVATRRRRAAEPVAAPLGAAFDGVRTAGVGQRLLAFLVDTVCVSAAGLVVLALTRSVVLAGLAAVEVIVGIVVWEARNGRTFGNTLLGLRSARQETPYAPGLARSVPRAFVLAAGHLVAGLGQWLVVGSVSFDKGGRGQGWHDHVGRSVVVDVRGPRAPLAAPSAGAGAGASAGAPAPVAVPIGAAAAGAGATTSTPTAPARATAVATAALAVPAAAAPAAVAAPTAYVVTLDTGQAMTVSGPGLVGRAPQVVPGERCDHVIAIHDPERSLSRTHARFGLDRAGFWVADAGSGNGTVVVLPSGQSVRADPEQRVVVPSGSTVRIGDRTFTVRAVAPR